MLSVLFMEQAEALERLVSFYAPAYRRAWDMTAGTGSLTERLDQARLVLSDRQPKDGYIALDLLKPDSLFSVGEFDLAVFDPPYLYGRKRLSAMAKDNWDARHSRLEQPDQFLALCEGAVHHLRGTLQPGGVCIVKVMNSRLNGQLVLNHVLAMQVKAFRLKDILVYIRSASMFFKNQLVAQTAHGFYLIYERPRRTPV